MKLKHVEVKRVSLNYLQHKGKKKQKHTVQVRYFKKGAAASPSIFALSEFPECRVSPWQCLSLRAPTRPHILSFVISVLRAGRGKSDCFIWADKEGRAADWQLGTFITHLLIVSSQIRSCQLWPSVCLSVCLHTHRSVCTVWTPTPPRGLHRGLHPHRGKHRGFYDVALYHPVITVMTDT